MPTSSAISTSRLATLPITRTARSGASLHLHAGALYPTSLHNPSAPGRLHLPPGGQGHTAQGTGSLNWSVDLSIAAWEGVSTDGGASGSSTRSATTATKVTKVELVNKGLTGSVPEELKNVGLTTLKLSGNTLTGCIPPELRDVATNDLSRLNLLYCDPGRPTLTVGTPDASSVSVSWAAIPETQAYRLEYIVDAQDEEWVVVSDSLTETTYTITTLQCETPYAFRVSAFGSGTGTAASWSNPSFEVLRSTAECLPEFGQDTYAFEVAENAGSYAVVGTVAATAPYADAVTYRIIGGNSEGKFSIDLNAGFIVVRQQARLRDHQRIRSDRRGERRRGRHCKRRRHDHGDGRGGVGGPHPTPGSPKLTNSNTSWAIRTSHH